jgi:hypothetical protein
MAKIISDTWAERGHPIYSEPLRSYSPHWARAHLKSKKPSPAPPAEPPAPGKDSTTEER